MARNKAQEVVELEDLEDDETDEVEEDATPLRPNDLAKELNISPKSLRGWLRTNFTRPIEVKNTSWTLTPVMVEAARDHFSPSDEVDETDEDEDSDEE